MRPQNNKITVSNKKQEVHNCPQTSAGLQFQSRNIQQQHQRLYPITGDHNSGEDCHSNLSSNSLNSTSQPTYMMRRALRENKHYRPEMEVDESQQEFQLPNRAPMLNFSAFNGQRPMKISARQMQHLEAEQFAQKGPDSSKQQQVIQEQMLNNQSNNLDQHQRYLRNQVHQQLQRVYGQTNEQERIAVSNLHRNNLKPPDEIQQEIMMKQQYHQHQQLKERINEQLHYRKQQQLDAAAAEVAKHQQQLNCPIVHTDPEDQFYQEQYRLVAMNQRRRKESSICSKTMNQDDLIYEQLASESLVNGSCPEELYPINRRPIKMINQHQHHMPIEMIREETSSEYQLQSDCLDTNKPLPPASYGLTDVSPSSGHQQKQQQPSLAPQVYERPTMKQQLSNRQQAYTNLPQLLVGPPTRKLQPVTLPIALSAVDQSVYERSLIPSNGFMYAPGHQANSNIALRAELISRLLFGSGIFSQLKGRFLEPYYSIPIASNGAIIDQSRPTISAVFAPVNKQPQPAQCAPLYGVIDKKQLAPVALGRPLSIIATTSGDSGGGNANITELQSKPPNVSIKMNDLTERKKKSTSKFNLKHLWILIFLLAIGTTFIAIFFNFK